MSLSRGLHLNLKTHPVDESNNSEQKCDHALSGTVTFFIQRKLSIITSAALVIARVIAVVAFCTGGSCKVRGMAIPAGRPLVINPAMFTKAGVRSVITSAPITCVMAFGAIIPEHSLVISRISMTAGAESRSIAETFGVAAFTSQIGVTVCQPERRQVVVKGSWLPGGGGMAGVATLPKTAIMFIV